jgi:hypothetical protein
VQPKGDDFTEGENNENDLSSHAIPILGFDPNGAGFVGRHSDCSHRHRKPNAHEREQTN